MEARHALAIIAFQILLFIGPSESILLLPLPDVCKFSGKPSYFVGINEARVSILEDLTSPYPANVDCTVHIVETGYSAGVRLSFTSFDMRPPDATGTCQDYIEMHKVEPETKTMVQLLGPTCGSVAPPNMTHDVNELLLRVKTSSTAQTQYLGFVMLYRKYRQAADASGVVTSKPVDTAVAAGAGVGAALLLVLLILFVGCIVCMVRHKHDLLRPKTTPQVEDPPHRTRNADSYLLRFNPLPSTQPAPLRLPRTH